MQGITSQRSWLNPWLGFIFALSLLMAGCSVKFVADYDSTTLDKILETGKKVDLFYGKLLETPEKARDYSKYSNEYVEIEVDMRDLVSRNKTRPLNSESTRISEIILKQWVDSKNLHKKNNVYKSGDAELDRDNFTDLFRSAEKAESVKDIKKK